MRRLRRFLISVCAAGLFLAAVASAGQADHGGNLWSGQWTTNTGGVGFYLMSASGVENAKREKRHPELWDKLPCKSGPQFYRGGYGTGKVIACGTTTRLRGRWQGNANPDDRGSFDITISSTDPLEFKGTAKPDGGAPFAYTGAFKQHFGGDGCCDSVQQAADREEAALEWAKSQLGSTAWSWRCQAFVQVAYRAPSGFRTANEAAAKLGLRRSPVTAAPPGSLLYFKTITGVTAKFGHVGLSLGGGKMISSLGKVAISSVTPGSKWDRAYVGWVRAPASWPGRR